MKYYRLHILYTILSAFAITLICCGSKAKYRFNEGMVWNTIYHITYNADRDLNDSVLLTLNNVGKSVSVFDSTSLVSNLNANLEIEADDILRKIYKTSVRINRESRGAFDPTLSPLITAWGFGKGHQPTADTARIDEILTYTGIGRTHLEGNKIIKDDIRTTFNFSAIAKGYGCDAVGEMLERNGCNDYLVEIGGEIKAKGVNPKGNKWNVAIDQPVPDDERTIDAPQIIIPISNCGMATSGNYRNFHEQDAGRYGHTIDPATGRPIQTDIISATVIAQTAMEADAYATACMVLGSKRALEMADRINLPIYLILSDNTAITSKAFDDLIP